MSPERVNILFVSPMPTRPPRFGAQARMRGLMTQLVRCHDLKAAMPVDDELDAKERRPPMQAGRRDVVLIQNSRAGARPREEAAWEYPMYQETRKKVLLLSYWINPDEVSASLDAYREYQQLRKHFDTTLVTHARNASALRKSGMPDGAVIYINVPILDRLHDLFLHKVLNQDYGSLKLTLFSSPAR